MKTSSLLDLVLTSLAALLTAAGCGASSEPSGDQSEGAFSWWGSPKSCNEQAYLSGPQGRPIQGNTRALIPEGKGLWAVGTLEPAGRLWFGRIDGSADQGFPFGNGCDSVYTGPDLVWNRDKTQFPKPGNWDDESIYNGHRAIKTENVDMLLTRTDTTSLGARGNGEIVKVGDVVSQPTTNMIGRIAATFDGGILVSDMRTWSTSGKTCAPTANAPDYAFWPTAAQIRMSFPYPTADHEEPTEISKAYFPVVRADSDEQACIDAQK